MRLFTAFSLSFFFALVIGSWIIPAPTAKPKPSPMLGAAQTSQPVTNPFEFLPAPPSSLTPFTSPSQYYDAAQQLMMKGRLREAQDQYLQILLSRTSIDQKALEGLARVQGLLTHGDPAALQRRADAYRQAIAQGSATGESYTPRELELLAEASLLAVQEIQSEQAPGAPIGSRVPTVSGLRHNSLPGPGTSSRVPAPLAPSVFGQQVLRLGQVLTPASAGPLVPQGETVHSSSSDYPITIPIPVLNGAPDGSGSGTGGGGQGIGSGGGNSSGWGGPAKGGTGSSRAGSSGSTTSWGSSSDGSADPDKRSNSK